MRKIIATLFGNIPCDGCGEILKDKKYLRDKKLYCELCRVK